MVNLLKGLDRGEHEYTWLPSILGRGCPDEKWMDHIQDDDSPPFVICADGRILRNKQQKEVLKKSGIHFVNVEALQNQLWQAQCLKLCRCWDDVLRACARVRHQTVIIISAQGRVHVEKL